jgi:aquaporin Z
MLAGKGEWILMELFKKALAEMIGTCVLVIIGCGVAVVTGCSDNGGIVATALAFGLAIVAMAYSIGNVSGCHINPAVSLGFLVAKKMKLVDFFVYVGAQIVGAILGAGILELFFMGRADKGGYLGSNLVNGLESASGAYNHGVALLLGVIVEIVLTFIFVLAILGVTSKDENGRVAGIVIGLTLTLVHLLGIPLTGTSVNPARSIGPALIALANGKTDAIQQIWVFIVGPFIGAAIAGLVFNALIAPKAPKAVEAK